VLRLTSRFDEGQASLRSYSATTTAWTGTSAHTGLELAWVRRGTLAYGLGRTEMVVPAGAAVLVPTGIEHRTLLSEGGAAAALHLTSAGLGLLEGELGPRVFMRALQPGLVLRASAIDALKELTHTDLMGSAATDAVIELVRARLDADELEHVRDRRIARAIERAFDSTEPARVEDLCAAAGMSRFHFSREFKRRTGKSPHQFLLESRLRHAAHLLESGAPVTLAATNAGFFDLSRFGQQFRRRFGHSPRQHAR
jgi:AraC-like DNA-binding protein